MTQTDPVELTARLIRCPSVTPADAGALDVLESMLIPAGFECTHVERGGIRNLFARWGRKGHVQTFGFNGHTDVVPVGDEAAWTHPPFGAEIHEGRLYGRGSTDMKSAVAAFVAAAIDFVNDTPPDGAVVVTVTGDEEGDALDGTAAILDYMSHEQERMSVCLVGEPSCPNEMGEMMKIGRRGSMTAFFTIRGKQGHAAYPHRALNPLPAAARLMERLSRHELDKGSEHFDPSTLALVMIETGNTATNVIPAEVRLAANVRFNNTHTGQSLAGWLRSEGAHVAQEFGVQIEMTPKITGESFLTPPGDFSDLVAASVKAVTGRVPVASTTGGTSDARFIKDHCPVVEFGLVGQTMHEVDENVEITQIHQLKEVYGHMLRSYFA